MFRSVLSFTTTLKTSGGKKLLTKIIEEKIKYDKFAINEWNQEYELIYSAYILEK